jgi:hypothetical protein
MASYSYGLDMDWGTARILLLDSLYADETRSTFFTHQQVEFWSRLCTSFQCRGRGIAHISEKKCWVLMPHHVMIRSHVAHCSD